MVKAADGSLVDGSTLFSSAYMEVEKSVLYYIHVHIILVTGTSLHGSLTSVSVIATVTTL